MVTTAFLAKTFKNKVMNTSELINKVKFLITESNIKEAIDLLNEIEIEDRSLRNSIIQLKQRWVDLEQSLIHGTIEQQVFLVNKNYIIKSLLDIISDIPFEGEKKSQIIEEKWSNIDDKLILEEILNLVSENYLSEAFTLLNFLLNKKNSTYSEYAVDGKLLESNYNFLTVAERNGTISFSEINSGKNRIIDSLIRLLSEMKDLPKKKLEAKKETERIEKSAATYVDESITALVRREQSLKNQALIWYILGFLSLTSGISIGLYYLSSASFDNNSNGILVYQIIKSLFIIGLLIATARYTFLLGKTYMNESLKNADRIHAISFGKFYLQVFGSNIKPEDLKEIFKDWNTAKDSAFVGLNSADFDPKFLEVLVKFVETIKK